MPAWESEAISRVDIFEFCRAALAWMTTVAVLWPVNAPMAALAFRIWRETKQTDIEGSELWIRAFLASGALALLMVGFVLVDWLLADVAEITSGPIHLVILIGFIALASLVVQYLFSLDDYFEGLSLVIVYLFLPLFVLFVLNALLGWLSPSLRFWDPLVNLASGWLVKPG
jgi:hypothetical protein